MPRKLTPAEERLAECLLRAEDERAAPAYYFLDVSAGVGIVCCAALAGLWLLRPNLTVPPDAVPATPLCLSILFVTRYLGARAGWAAAFAAVALEYALVLNVVDRADYGVWFLQICATLALIVLIGRTPPTITGMFDERRDTRRHVSRIESDTLRGPLHKVIIS